MCDSYIKVTVITPKDTRTGYAIYPNTITYDEIDSIAKQCLEERLKSNRWDWYFGIKTGITNKDITELTEFERNSSVKWERLSEEQVREANKQGIEWIGKRYIDTKN